MLINELRKINFYDLIKIDIDDPSSYSFDKYLKNNMQHKIKGFCISCEHKGINTAKNNNEYKLCTISHGAHSLDYIEAQKNKSVYKTFRWHEDGVVFLAETPSKDYKFYKTMEFQGFSKKPTFEWYWVHDQQDYYEFLAPSLAVFEEDCIWREGVTLYDDLGYGRSARKESQTKIIILKKKMEILSIFF